MNLERFVLVCALLIALPAQALLQPSVPPPDPGINGEATLEGIDTNNNGVRDDLEVAIFASYPDNPNAREILYHMSIYYQTLLMHSQTANVVLDSVGYLTALAPCLETATGTPSVGDSMLRPNALNTYDRSVAYINAMAIMDGSVTIPTRTVTCSTLPTYPVVPPGIPSSIAVPTSSAIFTYPISWGVSVGTVTRYELQQDINSGFTAPVLAYSGTALTRNVTVSQDGTYYYRVRACNTTGCSNYRTGTNGVTVATPPGVASSITVPVSSATGIYNVSWGTATGTITNYELQQDTNNSFTAPVTVYSGTALTSSISVPQNQTYYYRVRACNTIGCSGYRAGTNGVLVLPLPGTPSAISASLSSGRFQMNITVTWSAATGTISRYELQEAMANFAASCVVTQNSPIVYSGMLLTKSFIKPSFRKRCYRVRACNGVGCSNYSSAIEAQ